MIRFFIGGMCMCLLGSSCTNTEKATETATTNFSAKVSYRSNVPGYGDDHGMLDKTKTLEVVGNRKAIAEEILRTVATADLSRPGDVVQFEWHVGADLYEIRVRRVTSTMFSGRFRIYKGNGMLHVSTGAGVPGARDRFLEGLRIFLLNEDSYLAF